MDTLKNILRSRVVWVVFCCVLGAAIGLYCKGIDLTTEVAEVGIQAPAEVVTIEQPAEEPPPETPAEPVKKPDLQPTYVVETDDSGVKLASGHLMQESRIGRWENFHRNGQVESVGEYTNDVRTGIWRFFYPNGVIRSDGRFDAQGGKAGLWTAYHSNGDIRSEGKYANGVRTGPWIAFPYEGHTDYFWSGWLDAEGQRDKAWTWHAQGAPLFTDTYKSGKKANRVDHKTWKPSKTAAKPAGNMENVFQAPVFKQTDQSESQQQFTQRSRRRWR